MALLNITLNQDEILQLLANDRDAAFATLLQNSLNIILKAESAAQLKAEPDNADRDYNLTCTEASEWGGFPHINL